MATTEMMLGEAKVEAFFGQVFGDLIGWLRSQVAAIGQELELFSTLAAAPATATQFAVRAQIDERYALEWLRAMAASQYIDYDPITETFSLPAEHIPVLVEETAPLYLGGPLTIIPGFEQVYPRLVEAFRSGGGVPLSAYPESVWVGMEKENAPLYENSLIQSWLPQVPGAIEQLERGARVADIGCGAGRALLKLAARFPNSIFVGYDIHPPTIAIARQRAQAAGLTDRVRFEIRDPSDGLAEQFDIITTFDVVHDAVNPLGLMTAIRSALAPDGVYLLQEFTASDKLEENIGPFGAFFYCVSVLYCMTTSLADHGAGLGTAGMPESRVREFAKLAGFSSVTSLPPEDPVHALYVLRP
jgi:SAM-dependent methyltransferase